MAQETTQNTPQKWSDLSQEDKFNITRDYVRRGFHNLDDIVNDFNAKHYEEYMRQPDPEQAYRMSPSLQAIRETLREASEGFYG